MDQKKTYVELAQEVSLLRQEQAAIRQAFKVEFDTPIADDEDVLDLVERFVAHHKGKEAQIRAAKEAIELIGEGISYYQEMYQKELESADRWIKWCDKQKDTHGQNFWQGNRGAHVMQNIVLTRFLDACKRLASVFGPVPCCKRDHNKDGNCDLHPAKK